jgi:hypothetical protein
MMSIERDQVGNSVFSDTGIPDMHFINRGVPIAEAARALDLRFDCTGKIHCWHPERHQKRRSDGVGRHPHHQLTP